MYKKLSTIKYQLKTHLIMCFKHEITDEDRAMYCK